MEHQLKSALVILALSFQFGLISSAPIRISQHVPNALSRPDDLPSVEPAKILQRSSPLDDLPSVEPAKILQRSSPLDDLPPPQEPIKILRSTDHDVIIQISRSPGAYQKNETIRLQITNGEVLTSKEASASRSKESSASRSKESSASRSKEESMVSSEDGSVEVRSAMFDHSSGQNVEVLLVTLGPAAEELKPTALTTETKKIKKGKKKVSEKDIGLKTNATMMGREKSVKGQIGKGVSLSVEVDGGVEGIAASNKKAAGFENLLPDLKSILFPKSASDKSNLNQISKQNFENKLDDPPKSIRRGLLLKEIEINGMKHKNFGVFDEEQHPNKTIQPRRADLRLKDNKLLDNVINSAVASIANRKPNSLFQRQALRGPSIGQPPPNPSPFLNLGQTKFLAPTLAPITVKPAASLFNPLRRAERLETTFDGIGRLVDALSRIDYYISNSAKNVVNMLTHQHNTDFRMKRPELDDEQENDARYFRAATKKQAPQHEKLFFLHN